MEVFHQKVYYILAKTIFCLNYKPFQTVEGFNKKCNLSQSLNVVNGDGSGLYRACEVYIRAHALLARQANRLTSCQFLMIIVQTMTDEPSIPFTKEQLESLRTWMRPSPQNRLRSPCRHLTGNQPGAPLLDLEMT